MPSATDTVTAMAKRILVAIVCVALVGGVAYAVMPFAPLVGA